VAILLVKIKHALVDLDLGERLGAEDIELTVRSGSAAVPQVIVN
jgi:hypothetical protein